MNHYFDENHWLQVCWCVLCSGTLFSCDWWSSFSDEGGVWITGEGADREHWASIRKKVLCAPERRRRVLGSFRAQRSQLLSDLQLMAHNSNSNSNRPTSRQMREQPARSLQVNTSTHTDGRGQHAATTYYFLLIHALLLLPTTHWSDPKMNWVQPPNDQPFLPSIHKYIHVYQIAIHELLLANFCQKPLEWVA